MYLYKHYNQNMEIIYIGCCASLAKRQRQHLYRSYWRGKIFYIEYEVVEDSYALKLERSEIKKYRPTYNIAGVPAKRISGFSFYKPNGGNFPKSIWIVHVKNKEGHKYFGFFNCRFIAAEVADLMNFVLRKDYSLYDKQQKLY